MVTVLFVDLVGFTAMSSSRDAETVRELQTRYFDRAREVVARYGGAIEKFIGDAVMALWGAPTAHEDDAERAVRAALDLVETIPSLGQEAGVDLQLRAGVLTGQAAVGIGAVGQGMVTGDMVNTAARLQSIAPAGAVLVGDETRLAAGEAIAFEPAGEHELKGVPVPVRAWRALRIVGERGGARKPEALEPPFVGRGEELRFLKEQFHATGRERRARLVSLVGQAGIGKSRLAWELEKYLDGVVEDVAWHRGRSPAYGEGVTFWALSEAFRRRAGLSEGANEETTRSSVAAMVAEFVPDEAERAWIEPRILHVLGIGEAPSGGKAELFAAWRTFFERLAETSTVALVIEDLQWSDDGLLDFLEHLLDWGRSSPIFVLTLARPELLERRPGWGTDRRGATAMRLEPLSSEAMRELLEGMAPGLPERAVARILERAEGIPLYAVETVRMLVATGRLVQGAVGLVASPTAGDDGLDLADLDVPPTLHALVAARLDALPPEDRSLLQDAAVLGKSFTTEALAAMTSETPGALEPRLASLVRQELLAVETDPRSPSRGQHAFVQALLREVAFGTLSKRERRSRHLTAARYFESLGEDEVAGVVATHFVEAYRAAPEGPEGDAVAAQARISLLATADRAAGLGALGQAIDALKTALDVTRDPAQRAELHDRVGWLEVNASRWDDGLVSLSAALEAFEAIRDRVGVIRTTAHQIQGYLAFNQIGSAEEAAAQVRAEAEALVEAVLHDDAGVDRRAGEAAALIAEAIGRTAFRAFESETAIRWSDRALALAEPLRMDEMVAMSLVTKASALLFGGHVREGRALLEGAIADATAHGQSEPALRAQNNLASALVSEDPRTALRHIREGMATARRLGVRSYDGYHAGNGAGASERLGEWTWAREALGELVDVDPNRPEADWIALCRDYPTVWAGDPDTARAERLRAQAVADNDFQSERSIETWLARCAFVAGRAAEALSLCESVWKTIADGVLYDFELVGRVALHADRVDEARRMAELAAPHVRGLADHDLETVRAGIAAVEGRRDEAIPLYRAALAGYRDYGCRFNYAMTVLDMATFIGPEEPAVKALVPEARAIVVELEATPLIAWLDRVTESAGSATGTATAMASAPEPPRTASPNASVTTTREVRRGDGGA